MIDFINKNIYSDISLGKPILIPVILSGGTGSRLWPVSRENHPKPFMKLAGDLVIEQFLDISIVDLNDILNVKKSQINKLLSHGEIDICTFTYGLFPLVYKLTYRKTIFVCMLPNKKDYYICGIGTPLIVSGYSDKNLLLSNTLRENNRAGFFGFSRLSPMPINIGDFIRII